MYRVTRRAFALGATAGLAGCAGSMRDMPVVGGMFGAAGRPAAGSNGANYSQVYGRVDGERFSMPAVRYASLDRAFLRQEVAYDGREEPGTIVVDPRARFLYHVQGDGRAIRYGVGVGREGFAWSGDAQINMKRDWPDWVPPKEMVSRDPQIRAELSATPRGLGVPGGPKSPLGARAMYLYNGAGDTGYRIHGTLEPLTIGTEVSSGCVRMINQDIIHLYSRASLGTKVVVLS